METSPLFKLPGEIRNRIYELALYQPSGLTIRILTGEPRLLNLDNAANPIALAATCRQLHRECTSLTYFLNKFTLIAAPKGQRYDLEIWQKGLHAWLRQIGDANRRLLKDIEIDIGTSFMYDLCPSSETLWRSVSSLLYLFTDGSTRVSMKTDVCWMSRSRRAFGISIPLNNLVVAREVVSEVLETQRWLLEQWFEKNRISGREAGYRRMELGTCGQELRSYINLLEVTGKQ